MLRDWKTYVIHQAKFLGARRGEYSGVRQSDSDASSKATCALDGEEASISRARLQIFACSVAAVLGVILGISLGSMSLKLRECNQNISQAHEAYGHKGILPRIESNISVVFQPNYSYWNMSDFSSEQAWKAVGRNGNIYIKDPSRFGLEAGIEQSGDYEAFPISAFHQLHCLKRLREGYAALIGGFKYSDETVGHVDHCFDYLRQAVLCRADMTVEKARLDADGHRRATDGWGTAHQCTDWAEVMRVKTEYQYKYAI